MPLRHFKLQEGEMVQFSFLPALIAAALYDDEEMRKESRKKIAAELLQMLNDGSLVVRDPLTLEPLSFDRSNVPGNGVLTTDDLYRLLEAKGLDLSRSENVRISRHPERISVEDAMTLVIDAVDCPDDVIEGGMTAMERFVVSVEENFLSVCEELKIRPCLPYDPEEEYTGGEGQSVRFEITLDEFRRYVKHYGVEVEVGVIDSSTKDKKPAVASRGMVRGARKLASRRHALDHVIRDAQDKSSEPDNYLSVWAEMVRLAQVPNPSAPILGYVEGEGIKYLSYRAGDDTPQFFTKGALRKKMGRKGSSAH